LHSVERAELSTFVCNLQRRLDPLQLPQFAFQFLRQVGITGQQHLVWKHFAALPPPKHFGRNSENELCPDS
jgi:hypothetical protein